MTAVLSRHTSPDGVRFEVLIASTARQLSDVRKLREQIYVHELGILASDHSYVRPEGLVDPFDDWSTQLLCLADGQPVGTARVTEAIDGPLELEQYLSLDGLVADSRHCAEGTRFMVSKAWRGTVAGKLLAYGMWRLLSTRAERRQMLLAAKVGNLGRYYKNAGFTVLREEPFVYELTASSYQLISVNLGAAGGLRRSSWHLRAEAMRLAATRLGPVARAWFRRGFHGRSEVSP